MTKATGSGGPLEDAAGPKNRGLAVLAGSHRGKPHLQVCNDVIQGL